MSADYDRLRQLLLDREQRDIEALGADVRKAGAELRRVPEILADEIEQSRSGQADSRLANVLSDVTAGSLELAVRRRPQVVVDAVYPVIGPAIRRSLGEALGRMADELDDTLRNALGWRTLAWRWEAWHSGVPYAQVVLRHIARYQVEHLFLVHPESGLLLGHVTARGVPELDADAVAGMFTAIQQFVRDSVPNDTATEGFGSATVGSYHVLVSDGPNAKVVAFVRGVPARHLVTRLHEINEEVHRRHGDNLLHPTAIGQAGPGFLEQQQLDELSELRAVDDNGKRSRRKYLLLCAIALATLAFVHIALEYRWSRRVDAIRAGFSQIPGFTVLSLDDQRRGQLQITGMLDPLTADPRGWLAKNYPDVKADWRLSSFLSLEPEVVRRRVAKILELPNSSVSVPDNMGVVHLTGEVPFRDWYRAVHSSFAVDGVSQVDGKELQYPEKAQVEALISALVKTSIAFSSGSATPEPGTEQVTSKMRADIAALEKIGKPAKIAFHIRTVGYTDEPGSSFQNRDLRTRRAEWLATQLADAVWMPSSIASDRDAALSAAYGDRIRAASVAVTPFPVMP